MRGYRRIVLFFVMEELVCAEKHEDGRGAVSRNHGDELSADEASELIGAPFDVDFGRGMDIGMILPMGEFSLIPMNELYDAIDDVHELAGRDNAVIARAQQPKRLRHGMVPVGNVLNGLLGQMLSQMMTGSLGGIEGESTFSMNTTASEVVIAGQLPKQTLRSELGEEDNGITVKQIGRGIALQVRKTDGPLVTEIQRYYPMSEDCLLEETKVVYDQKSGKLRVTVPRNSDMSATDGGTVSNPEAHSEEIKRQLDEEAQRDGVKVRFGDDDTLTVIVPTSLGRMARFNGSRIELESGRVVTIPVEVNMLLDEYETDELDAREHTFRSSEVSRKIPITNDEL